MLFNIKVQWENKMNSIINFIIQMSSQKTQPRVQQPLVAQSLNIKNYVPYFSHRAQTEEIFCSREYNSNQDGPEIKNSNYKFHIKDTHTESEIGVNLTLSVGRPSHHRTESHSSVPYSKNDSYTISTIGKTQRPAVVEEKPFAPLNSSIHSLAKSNRQEFSKNDSHQSSRIRVESEELIRQEGTQDSPQVFQYATPLQVSPFMKVKEQQKVNKKKSSSIWEYYKERNAKKQKPLTQSGKVRTVEICLNKKKQEKDKFRREKELYLNKLKQKQRSESLKKTVFHSKNKSLSPQCERITERLYTSRTNKQPCMRYWKHHELDRRTVLDKVLSEYSFLQKYLSDKEINDIGRQLQREGIPTHRWGIKMIEIAYEKVGRVRRYVF